MSFASYTAVSLIAMLMSCPKSESASTEFIAKPSTPSPAVEGQNFTLEWNYTLDGTLGSALFKNVSSTGSADLIGKRFGPGIINVEPEYQERFRAQVTNTRAELTILQVQRSDQGTYTIDVLPTGSGSLDDAVEVIVQYPPKITSISLNQTVDEGDVVLLNCTADGSPEPNIAWTRLSDNSTVNRTLAISCTGEQYEVGYRCTADNGIGRVSFSDVFFTFQCPPKITSISLNQTVVEGDEVLLNCTAVGNPEPNTTLTRLSDNSIVNRTLTITGKQDGGGYRCTAVNGIGDAAFSDVFITVQYPPSITSISLNQTVADEGDVVLLNCTADGNPEPNITWNRLSSNGADVRVGPAETYLNIAGKQDEGGYRCIADNGIGNAAFSDVLNITVKSYHPINTVFSTNLTNNTVNVNESFTLKCNADANPAATFRLYREQKSSQEQSNGTYLTFVSTRTKQVTYTCIPFNDFGDGLSKTISVTVYYNPATVHLVTNTTENENCCDFLVISFTCKASEANPPVENYQLLKNQEIVGTSSKVTWIKTILSKGNHIYSCKALHRLGNVGSADVTVTFNVPVQIFVHVQSGSETPLEGDNVSLYCNASGYPEPTVTWTKLNADDLIVSSQSLNFSIISKEATGEYICSANNTCGEKRSAARTIDVQYKPENAYLNTSNHKICAGKMVILTCSAGDSNPAVENFTLYKNGLRLANVTRANVGVFNQVLYTQGQHIYSCVASNVIGIASSSNAIVEVEAPASVTVENRTIVVREGDTVTLHCMSSGFPQPNVSWVNNSNYIMEAGNTLNLTNIRRHNREYNCSASNACGSDSRQVDIDVQYAAEVTGRGGNYSVREGSIELFSCPVDGNPEPVITWYKDNDVIEPEIPSAKQLEAGETGCYTCSAMNRLGPAVTVTQCLIVVPEEPTPTGQPTNQVYAELTMMKEFVAEYRDLNNQVSKQLVDSFVLEMDKVYQNDSNYIRTEVTGLRSGSVIVSFILYFKNSVTPSEGLKELEAAISNDTFGTYQFGNLTPLSPGASTFTSTTPQTAEPTGMSYLQVHAEMTIMEDFVSEYRDLNNQVSKQFVDSFVLEMNKIYQPDDNYLKCEVIGLRSGSVIVSFILYFKKPVTPREGLTKLEAAISNNTFGTYQVGNLTPLSPGAGTFTSTTPRTAEPTDGPPWIIIGAVAGGVVLVALVVGFVTWWVHKKRKCIKDTKTPNAEFEGTVYDDIIDAQVNRTCRIETTGC